MMDEGPVSLALTHMEFCTYLSMVLTCLHGKEEHLLHFFFFSDNCTFLSSSYLSIGLFIISVFRNSSDVTEIELQVLSPSLSCIFWLGLEFSFLAMQNC